jgi:hypothetical protein
VLVVRLCHLHIVFVVRLRDLLVLLSLCFCYWYRLRVVRVLV